MAIIGAAISNWLVRICILLLALLFLAAGLAKIMAADDFVLAVWNFQLLSWQASLWVARILPWFEIVLGLWLLIPWQPTIARLLTCLLLIIFSAALVSAMARGLDIGCGCFGPQASPSAQQDLIIALGRNVVLIAMAIFTIVADRAKREQAA